MFDESSLQPYSFAPKPEEGLAAFDPDLNNAFEQMTRVLDDVDRQNYTNLAEARAEFEAAVAAATSEFDGHKTEHDRISDSTGRLRSRLESDVRDIIDMTRHRAVLVEQRQQVTDDIDTANNEQTEADEDLRRLGSELRENTGERGRLDEEIRSNQTDILVIDSHGKYSSAEESTETQIRYQTLHDSQAELQERARDLRVIRDSLITDSADATMRRSEIEARIEVLNNQLAQIDGEIRRIDTEKAKLDDDIDKISQVINGISISVPETEADDENADTTRTSVITILPVEMAEAETPASIPAVNSRGPIIRSLLGQIRNSRTLEPIDSDTVREATA